MTRLLTAALLAATALPLSSLPAAAFDPANMSESESQAFGQAVRDYIMANPEVLIEAVNSLEERRLSEEVENDRAMIAANQEAIFDDGHSWVGGNPDGDLTMVEFVDYRCSVCRRVYEEVETLVKEDGNIRFVLKEFPILGQESDLASRFAIAVKQTAGMDMYKTVHDRLMTLRGPVTMESLSALATDLGLEAEPLINRMNTEEVSAEIRENAQLAERMRVMGTPTFVVGTEMLRGVPATGLTGAVAHIRAEAEG
ncbi:DsbA family protein [uncultured Paracoccus sp.]|uniref:DsbA family protein n=1 Tax=uncultured Paracoccus sp. TaxID=189685 RepID=UPI002623F0CC|nr:DsbA family protein [uncultured Paracoccus sp.]